MGDARFLKEYWGRGRRKENRLSMDRIEIAVSRFAQGFCCSQAVLSVYAGQFGLDDATASKIAAGFGGGMGLMAETCGAVTGAFMVLGLRYGGAAPDREAKDAVYAQIGELVEQFKARHGSLTCKNLLGCDIGTPEGYRLARQKNLFGTTCPTFVRDAVAILEEMLAE
jgi:C_GCAxxG_C_C family probable redox protein